MADLNTMLMQVIADLDRRVGEACVLVTSNSGDTMRTLHVAQGCLVAADSNVQAERLGDMLSSEGLLDPVFNEPVAEEARRRGALLGDQLVADGLLSLADLSKALERQALVRFHRTLAMHGTVSLRGVSKVQHSLRQPLGTAVVAAFHDWVDLEAIKSLIDERPKGLFAMKMESEAFRRLAIRPTDLRICRILAAGEPMELVVDSGSTQDGALRLIGALVALGHWS